MSGSTWPDYVEQHASATPQLPAVRTGDGAVSFGALNARANRMARQFLAAGLNPGDIVAVILDQPAEMAAALLGILKAGGTGLLIDPGYHPTQLAAIVDDARPALTVTATSLTIRLPRISPTTIYLDTDAAALAAHDDSNLSRRRSADDVALISYDPGLGRAAVGATITHRALVHGLDAESTPASLALTSSLMAAGALPIALRTIARGGSVFVVPQTPDVASLVRTLSASGAGAVELSVEAIGRLAVRLDELAPALASAREIIVFDGMLDAGSTEALSNAGLRVTTHRVISDDGSVCAWARVHGSRIERVLDGPLVGASLIVLDEQMKPVNDGIGEAYAAGPVLAGYAGHPVMTSARFVAAADGERVYRVGCLIRVQPGGECTLVGRAPSIDLRGTVIDLDRVEAALRELPGVDDAVVAPRRIGDHDGLAAYVAAGAGIGVAQLRSGLGGRVPAAMMPDSFVSIERVPRVGAAVDYGALPMPEPEQPAMEQPYTAARNVVEAALVEMWATALLLDRVGVHDDFLELGGDSLIANQIMAQIWDRFATEIPMQAFFEQCTVAGLTSEFLAGALEAERRK